ncbi:MAG: GNAT family N-acetyltransferase, partial [Candidatus Bathyarchaeia archaeon]
MPIKIEDISIEYLDRLYEIEIECFKKEAFTKQQIAQLLQNSNTIGLVAKEYGEIIGFIIGVLSVEDNIIVGHILTIDVSPNYRRRGVGIRLLQEIERIFKNKQANLCRLEVKEDNVAALNLYR